MKLIDTHVHLLKETYENNLQKIIENVNDNFDYVWNISWDIKTAIEVVELNKKFEKLLPIIGIHPNNTMNYSSENLNNLEKLLFENKSRIIAIGEIGLDYYRNISSKELQKKAFIDQIELAKKNKLPVIIHSRNAIQDVFSIIKNYTNMNFLIHSLSCDITLLKQMIKYENIYYSFNGILTFDKSKLIENLLLLIPKEKILPETDCPWLTPIPKRGEINIPNYVEYVIEKISQIWNLTIKETIEILKNNAKKFINS